MNAAIDFGMIFGVFLMCGGACQSPAEGPSYVDTLRAKVKK
eukprot:gene10481-1905_t